MTDVTQLVKYMKPGSTKNYHLICEKCRHKFYKILPIGFPLAEISCPSCGAGGKT